MKKSAENIPVPLFDTLENLADPFQIQRFDVTKFYSDKKLPADAATDYRYSCSFLYSYRGSQATFNSYRREIERLLQWCWLIQKKSLRELKRQDFETFVEFCQNPPKSWIGLKQVARYIDKGGERVPNPEWHLFVASTSKKDHREGKVAEVKNYLLSPSALQAIFSILGSFFNYLQQEEYATINPVAQIRQKSKFIRKQQGQRPIRRLSELQWAYVIETAELMATENPELHERTLFIMNALFGMYLRISELAASLRWTPQMGHFHRDLENSWWFKTVGKGNKERDISVSDSMLNALKRYRLSLGLSAMPSPGETMPLIPKFLGKGPVENTRHIRKIVQDCFDQSISRLQADNFTQEAEMLMSATVHWLRHTGISEDVKHRPREHVRDDAGHSTSMITDRYIDVEMRARHASAKKKLIKPD